MTLIETPQEKITSLLKDPSREITSKPIKYKDYWVMTDAKVCVFLKNSGSAGQEFDFTSILDKRVQITTIEITLDKLKAIRTKCNPIPELKYGECKDCNGFGEVECECCGHEKECETCDGDGDIVIGETGRFTYDERYSIKITEAYLSIKQLHKLIQIIEFLGFENESISITHSDKTNPTTFQIKDHFFLVMPLNPDAANTYKIKSTIN